MDCEAVSAQLIRALRGSRSQTAFSRHLGYRCNVLYTWESGRRWPTAATFFRVALKAKLNLHDKLVHFLGDSPAWLAEHALTDPRAVAAFLSDLRGSTTSVELARRVGTHRVSVSRWLHGGAEPRLPDFLRLVDAASSRLLDFVSLFTDPAELPECSKAWRELLAQRHVAYHLPWSHAVLRALELVEYQHLPEHREGWIASKLGIDLELELTCIEALAASKLIARRRKRWVITQVLTVDIRVDPDAGRRLKEHWAGVGVQRLAALEPNRTDLFSYNLFTVSERDFERIRELHIAYYNELRGIVAKSEPGERVVLANLQLLRLDQSG